MREMEFNLLKEGWILANRPDGVTEEVSLLELFRRAPEFNRLAGELPTQDFAVLRLLLAILHVVLGEKADGTYLDLPNLAAHSNSPGGMLTRWKAIWEAGCFPISIIEEYLKDYEDRFWLFHPNRPFYQVPNLTTGTKYASSKLNGILAESANKLRLFPQRVGKERETLSYAEAARWLLYLNGFDDTSAKPSQRKQGLGSPGAGWLGKLGLIAAVGDNLFETLMLNLVLLRDGGNELWGVEHPTWESLRAKASERTEIDVPDNLSELLTLQSRRLLLNRSEGVVAGYTLLGGDFFRQSEEIFSEQMTVWYKLPKEENGRRNYNPKRHQPARQLWRDFSSLVGQSEGLRRPGVVSWLSRLKTAKILKKTLVRFQTAAVKYGDKDFFADDVFGDTLSFSTYLLINLGDDYANRIISEIETTDQLVNQVGYLAQNLAKAAGDILGHSGIGFRNTAKEQAYYRLDIPFRQWLDGINPEEDDLDTQCKQWWEQAQDIIRNLGKELLKQTGPQTFVGRTVTENKKQTRYTGSEVYNVFLYKTVSPEALKGGKNRT